MRTMVDAALHYASLGYAVFPCTSGTRPAPLTPHGFKDATTDIDQIAEWWHVWPTACIGISATGLLVVDVDGKENAWLADQPDLARSLAAVPTSTTPGGGRHHIFRRPTGKEWRCSVSELAPRVDIRTDGGLFIAPPSLRSDGAYLWVEGCELEVPRDRLPEAPSWLCKALDELAQRPERAKEPLANSIPEGQRNTTLTRLAGTMRRMGMTQAEIYAGLAQVNLDRCDPPLQREEIEKIAASIASYPPDQIATAVAENHYGQMLQSSAKMHPLSLGELTSRYQDLRRPVIHGLLRQGETMNIISSPKVGKSWLVIDLALAVAGNRAWLDTFITERGSVLIIDNELHSETSAHRIPKVAAARRINIADVQSRLYVQNLRGYLQDIFSLAEYFRSLEPGRFQLVILDAMYRFMPADTDENDNGSMARIYNVLDRYADALGCSFVLIHHTSKGSQSSKAITDVGAGAGSQSRATDTHLILRPHEVNNVVVLDAAVRSFPPVEKRCLLWQFPVFIPANELDPAMLRVERPRRRGKEFNESEKSEPKEPSRSAEWFAQTFVGSEPKHREVILHEATSTGLSERQSQRLLRSAEATGFIFRWNTDRNRSSMFANFPQPPSTETAL